MKIVFFSNFLNHHQLPICKAFLSKSNVEFIFVATEELPNERKQMNYRDMNHLYDFVLRTYEGQEQYNKALFLAKDADIAIIGSAPIIFLRERMALNKITFRFCERSLKKGLWRRFIPFTYKKIYEQYIKYRNSNLYILAASAFTSYDLNLCGFPENKCYKWGYFPELIIHNDFNKILLQKDKYNNNNRAINFLWTARFIPLKHPEIPLFLIRKLLDNGYNVRLDMIGDGIMVEEIKKLIIKLNLVNYVTLLGSVSPEEVRLQMENHDIFLFTSNKYEGWGAVVNEAMNSGCVVIASKVIGSVPYLIKDGLTGFSYDPKKNIESLYEAAIKLINNPSLRYNIALNAYNSLLNEWNADTAVDRFFELVNSIQNNGKNSYISGPCSPANIQISK